MVIRNKHGHVRSYVSVIMSSQKGNIEKAKISLCSTDKHIVAVSY